MLSPDEYSWLEASWSREKALWRLQAERSPSSETGRTSLSWSDEVGGYIIIYAVQVLKTNLRVV